MNEYGRALSRWRRRRGVKQSHAAELFGVSQASLSRWERGYHRLPDAAARKLTKLLAAPLDSSADAGLRRLVESSALPVHLICDLTHRLLAASPQRFAEWTADASDLRGTSLWRFATDRSSRPRAAWASSAGTTTARPSCASGPAPTTILWCRSSPASWCGNA